jgi:hypothetical protein
MTVEDTMPAIEIGKKDAILGKFKLDADAG